MCVACPRRPRSPFCTICLCLPFMVSSVWDRAGTWTFCECCPAPGTASPLAPYRYHRRRAVGTRTGMHQYRRQSWTNRWRAASRARSDSRDRVFAAHRTESLRRA
uniref:Putative secreted protein n=1 Tax=Anopheles marajoara TaxID=58244 RepID=A0A2M4C8I9_9DIPT